MIKDILLPLSMMAVFSLITLTIIDMSDIVLISILLDIIDTYEYIGKEVIHD